MTVGSARVADEGVITVQERELLNAIDKDHQASKPSNTIKAYKAPQEEWHKWCHARAIAMGEKPLDQLSETERALASTKRQVATEID
jgi:hypothetical protein